MYRATAFLIFSLLPSLAAEAPWKRHVVDASLYGADGVRLKDINGDGLPDIAVGWEEGRSVRIYFHPPKAGVRAVKSWRFQTVGQVCSPEDAVFADLDQDGHMDVISACEEKQPTGVFVHWGPNWRTEAIGAADRQRRWIYTLPMQMPQDSRWHIIAGGKLDPAGIVLLSPPQQGSAREVTQWVAKELTRVGWTMSILDADMDGDGDRDLLVSDRRGPSSGIFWLEYPSWERHNIDKPGRELMFIDYGDLNGDGLKDVAAAIRSESIVWLERLDASGLRWKEHTVPYPSGAGTAKGIAIGDLNGDGLADLAFSCEHADAPKEGMWWIEQLRGGGWKTHRVSGPEGIKFDRIELVDFDGDGDLDILSTEERTPLGVVWYENPAKD